MANAQARHAAAAEWWKTALQPTPGWFGSECDARSHANRDSPTPESPGEPHDCLQLILPPDVADEPPADVDELVGVSTELAELQAAPLLNVRVPNAPTHRASRSQICDAGVGIPAGHALGQVRGQRMDVGEHLV